MLNKLIQNLYNTYRMNEITVHNTILVLYVLNYRTVYDPDIIIYLQQNYYVKIF